MAISDALRAAVSRTLKGPLKTSYRDPVLIPRAWGARLALLGAVTLLVLAPFVASAYLVAVLVDIGIGVIGAVWTNLLMGVARQATIGNAAFMAIGAFSSAQVAVYLHWPFFVAILVGGATAGLVGLGVGVPAMRVRGLYLVVTTLALHYVALYVLEQYQVARVGVAGFLMPAVQFGALSSAQSWYLVVVLLGTLSVFASRNLLRSRIGRGWAAVGRDEIAAAVLGVRVKMQKVVVFGISSAAIGVQGAVYGYYLGVVSTDPFTFTLAVSYVAMIIIGGQGTTLGSLLGAGFVIGLPYAVTAIAGLLPPAVVEQLTPSLSNFEVLLYGAFIVVFLIFEPRGLVYIWRRLGGAVRRWPLGSDHEGG